MKVKKRGAFLFLIVAVVFTISFSSALGLSDVWDKITGKATSGSTSLNITVGNNAPTVSWVQSISAQDPVDDGTRSITFNFTATDADGYQNINSTTAEARFQRAGETTRSNTSCVSWAQSGNNMNFTCTIDMWYYDENGAWTINVTIYDVNSAYGENSSTTFTYNLLTAMKMSPSALNWPEVGLSSTDTGSNNDPVVVNNTGNDATLNINVTAYNLQGDITDTEYIYANNFSVDNVSEGCSGNAMSNATSLNITNALLLRGNHSLEDGTGQEDVYFCLKGLPQDISSQSYSSAAIGSWVVEIIT